MASEPSAALEDLNLSIEELEEVLDPLFQKSWEQTLADLDLVQKAKMQVSMAYVIQDLVFVYLKMRGIDPMSHPIVNELKRIKQYFDKIKQTETPDQRTLTVDKSAAKRFVTHALAANAALPSESEPEAGPSGNVDIVVPFAFKGKHTKFTEDATEDIEAHTIVPSVVVARRKPGRPIILSSDAEDEGGDDSDVMELDEEEVATFKRMEKGKNVLRGGEAEGVEGNAKKRPVMDPFAGYDDLTTPQKSKKNKPLETDNPASSSNNIPPITPIKSEPNPVAGPTNASPQTSIAFYPSLHPGPNDPGKKKKRKEKAAKAAEAGGPS